jgi:hypothetical protein
MKIIPKEELFEQVLRLCPPERPEWTVTNVYDYSELRIEFGNVKVFLSVSYSGELIKLCATTNGVESDTFYYTPQYFGLTEWFDKEKYDWLMYLQDIYVRVATYVANVMRQYTIRQHKLLEDNSAKVIETLKNTEII